MKKLALLAICLLSSISTAIYFIKWPLTMFDTAAHPIKATVLVGQEKNKTDKLKTDDIMIGILLTDRMGYADFTSSVIRKYHDIADNDIHVFTVKKYGYSKSRVLFWYGKNIKIVEGETIEISFSKVLQDFVHSRYKILFLVDSEMVFLPRWRDFIMQNLNKEKVPFISLYHSATNHSFHADCENLEGTICKGNIYGKLGVAMSKDFAETIALKHFKMVGNRDWNTILDSEKLQGRYPTNSIIMNIGQTNQDKDFCGENDVPYMFQLCQLPEWIKNGIEFYFDRCTNTQEMYSAANSISTANIEQRLWARPVVAYSFYGNNPRYVKGSLANAKRIFKIYPGYKMWVFVDASISPGVVNTLCSCNVRFVNMTGTSIKNQMSWRFLIAAEPVRWFTILDIDYAMLPRGKNATDEWLKSGKKFHVMRDHPNHSKYPINGQMWGGFGNSIPNMKDLILEYNGNNNYMVDINFLTAKVWPIVKQSVWIHDAYSLHKFGEDHPFPMARKGSEYIGDVDFS